MEKAKLAALIRIDTAAKDKMNFWCRRDQDSLTRVAFYGIEFLLFEVLTMIGLVLLYSEIKPNATLHSSS